MRFVNVSVGVIVAAIALLLGLAVIELQQGASGAGAAARAHMNDSGVGHPVTAVLLNFRSYDTWLELVVLWLAVLGAMEWRAAPGGKKASARDPVRRTLIATLVPLMVLVAALLLERGAHAPGGAFQAGAVLAAAIVLLYLGGRDALSPISPRHARFLLVMATGVFAVAAVSGLLLDGTLLRLRPAHAGLVIIVIEIAATLSIALALACLVIRQPMEGDLEAK